MATTKPIQLRALVAATGALSAAIMLAGPFAGNAVATPAPPTPVVSGATVHFSKNHAYLTLQTTPCTGCTLQVASRYGANAAYPSSLHGKGVQKLLVWHRTRVEMLRDLTTYKLSVWQRSSGVDSATPAHLTITVGEDLFELQSKVFTQPLGPHSLEVDYNMLGDNITQDLAKLSIYVAFGHTPPGSAKKPPTAAPAWTCRVPHCPRHFDATAIVKGLRNHRHYSLSLYGFDAHGNARRGTAQGTVVGIGSYIDGNELRSGLTAFPGALAVDRDGSEHELAFLYANDIGAGLTYVTRPPGAKSFVKTPVRGAADPDTMLLTSSVDGESIDVVLASCRAISVIQVAASANRLPRITAADKVLPQYRCGDGGDGTDASPDLQAAVALSGGRIALLFDDNPRRPHTDPGETVYIGRPGHHFVKTVLPGSVRKVPGGVMTRDPSNGAVYVANTVGNQIDVWKLSTSATTWSRPAKAASISGNGGDNLSSIAATDGQIWLGIYRDANGNDGYSRATPATDGAFIAHRDAAGHWSAVARLPHSGRLAQGILLATSPAGGSIWELDSLVSRHGGNAASGLEERQLRVGSGWSRPTRLTHWYTDVPESIVASWQNSLVYAHQLF
jgi:hypothetical protein